MNTCSCWICRNPGMQAIIYMASGATLIVCANFIALGWFVWIPFGLSLVGIATMIYMICVHPRLCTGSKQDKVKRDSPILGWLFKF